jgi:sulfate transport system permease protein
MSTLGAVEPVASHHHRRALLAKYALRYSVLLFLAFLVVIPVGSIAWRALSPGLGTAWRDLTGSVATNGDPFIHSLLLTLLVAAIAVPINTVFGVGTAILLARHRFPGSRLLDAAIDLPIAMSPVVIGFSLALVYGQSGWIGQWLAPHGLQIIFSVPGIVLASTFVSLPYVTRSVLPVLQEVGTEQEQAAATLGAGAFATLWRITLPSIRWGVAYGVTLTTARVLGEFGAVSIVSGDIIGRTQTLTLWVNYQFSNENTAGAYTGALILAVIALVVLALLSISQSKEKRLS